MEFYLKGLKPFKRKAFVNTETELKLIAMAAIIGFKSGPPNKCSIPMATGIPNVL